MAAKAILPEFLESQSDAAFSIDAGEVEYLGYAMMQLLTAISQTGCGLKLISHSQAFRDAITLAKLEEVLLPGEVE